MREAALAAAIVALAIVTLGTDWTGVEVAPGVWRDRVTLSQWAFYCGELVILGAIGGRWLHTWPRRIAVVLPTLAWLAWQLRAGTLWPVALALYGTGITVSWLIGCGVAAALVARRRR